LNPLRNTLPLANHTKSVDLEPLKNTQHSLATQTRNTVIKEEGNRIHLGITKLKVQNYNPIISHTLKNDPKLFQTLEKMFLINSFSYSKIRSVKPSLYRPTKWSKTFNKGAKVVRII